ncbi:Cytochrome P460 [Candidatus Electronema halotolerans]
MGISMKKAILFSVMSLCFTVAAHSEEPAKTVKVTDSSFKCLHQMKKVRNMHVDNLLGNLEGTLAVANAAAGGVYPPGTVVQTLPGEAMVKLDKGASPATNDWEFFVLEITPAGSRIKERGFAEVTSLLGGSCLTCHSQAKAQWDMICEQGHGCNPIELPGIDTQLLIKALQKTDPRCPPPEAITKEEMTELGKLQELLVQRATTAAVLQPE